MSMLKFLSRSLTQGSGSSSSAPLRRSVSTNGIKLYLRVPSYGSVFMPFPDPTSEPDAPRQDMELSGDLEIELPSGFGAVRCKSIRVGLRTTCKLDMGVGRGVEEDTLWTGKAELMGSTSDGIILEEGLQRFAFTIIIPGNLAAQDFAPGHRVDNTLFAEIEGIQDPRSLFAWNRRSSTLSSSSSVTPRSAGTRSPSPLYSPNMSPSPSLTILRQETMLPQPPAYNLDDLPRSSSAFTHDENEIPWLTGVHSITRELILLYNPDPTGGVNSLDARVDGDVPGLGPYVLNFAAGEWCIYALLKATVNLLAPSPESTIYHVRVSLHQKAEITSPRDGAEVTVERLFPITAEGVPPDLKRKVQKADQPAIWRGVQAGGQDDWELRLDGQGRLPNDYHGRPTTLEGVETPIRVSHALRTEVWFSVRGEDANGRSFGKDVPGELRILRVEKPVIVPSCFLIPEVLDLPIYGSHRLGCFLAADGQSDIESDCCPLCKTPAKDQFCQTCPPTSIPHPRHDHPKKLVGTSDGTCPSCTYRSVPAGGGAEWRACACGLLREDIISRMKRVTLDERELEVEEEQVQGRRWRAEKVEAERGRSTETRGLELNSVET
ncbi:hypothetical protein BD324DRAFT_612440 [Kockovaella imperatae]|uniref:Arrestin-like N-terminal domain-containing protein n=1 Tax=Kockovaella imperatae TaxID=4999 RepID=A0A1Y1USF2_9TREE|nr:hypothetical protein BD324DRAFT_612440 [Kockovaella imperatae]ORX40882.1 hypothetical protein BD324DRAFT_612440 [Kockovaella imperatae]